MFEVYPIYGGLEFPAIAKFEERGDAEELCLALAQHACYERYILEQYRGIWWENSANTLLVMGSHYVREVD